MYMYSNEVYWIGEYEDYNCERGIAQFMNRATSDIKEENNCDEFHEVVSSESHSGGSAGR